MDKDIMLPFEWPISETYQNSAFVIGVLLANANIRNAYWNNFLRLDCVDADDVWDIDLKFSDVSWEDFRVQGIFEMDLFRAKCFSQDSIVWFLEERLNQGNYVLLHSVDEFFLPYSNVYERQHFLHDAYLLGYSEKEFYVLAYASRKLQLLKVEKARVAKSILASLEVEPETAFCSLRPYHTAEVRLDISRLRSELRRYIGDVDGNNDCKPIHGLNVFDILINCLKKLEGEEQRNYEIDSRPFRLLKEHCAMMAERLKITVRLGEEDAHKLQELEDIANIVFMLSIKYNTAKDVGILQRMICYLDELKNEERLIVMSCLKKRKLYE